MFLHISAGLAARTPGGMQQFGLLKPEHPLHCRQTVDRMLKKGGGYLLCRHLLIWFHGSAPQTFMVQVNYACRTTRELMWPGACNWECRRMGSCLQSNLTTNAAVDAKFCKILILLVLSESSPQHSLVEVPEKCHTDPWHISPGRTRPVLSVHCS